MEIRVSNEKFKSGVLCTKVFDGEVRGPLTLIIDQGFSAEIFEDSERYDSYAAGTHELKKALNRRTIQLYAKRDDDQLILFGLRVPNKCIINGQYEVSINSLSRIRNIDMYTGNSITDDAVRDKFNKIIQKLIEKCDMGSCNTPETMGEYIKNNITQELNNNGLSLKILVVNYLEKI